MATKLKRFRLREVHPESESALSVRELLPRVGFFEIHQVLPDNYVLFVPHEAAPEGLVSTWTMDMEAAVELAKAILEADSETE